MKSILYLVIAASLANGAWNAAQTNPAPAQSDKDATQKLAVFIGKWESAGTFSETKLSHAHKVGSSIDCRWSALGDFLICEQSILDGTEKHIQLSIYSYNSKEDKYTISSMAGPGQQPWNGTVIIKGSIWTYPGGFEKDGKRTEIRTINDFSVPSTETFKTEYSEDGGAHWTTMLEGTAHKVAG